MNRKRSQLQAYFAGLFDGEGSLGVYGLRQKQLQVTISMVEPVALALIRKEYPTASVRMRPARYENWQPQYTLHFTSNSAYTFLKEIEPFVLVKWDEVKVGLTFLAHMRQERFNIDHKTAACSHCLWAEAALKQLKRPTGNKQVKTVDILNRHGLRQYRAKAEDVKDDITVITAMFADLQQRVETRDRDVTPVEPISACEKDIVQLAA